MLHARVETLRDDARHQLTGVLRETGGTRQGRLEREAAAGRYAAQVARYDAAENGLCFGRLDLRDGDRHYIGRVGLPAESADDDPLLLDWRAPAARPFYVATPAAPHGVRKRRHITTRGGRVVRLDDEVLDHDGVPVGELTGEAALLASLDAGRTGRMHDIVATLQAEQDAIIRSDHRGVLVVQGGPGTGKTAVALHRAAYLLYTHRQLASRGVLVVGPNPTFIGYIGQVLPGLGENSVLLSTVGELFPGVRADRTEPPETAELKGRTEMAAVIAAAVRDRQVPAGTGLEVEFDGDVVRLDHEECVRAADVARATRLPHNRAAPSSGARSSPRWPGGPSRTPATSPTGWRRTSPRCWPRPTSTVPYAPTWTPCRGCSARRTRPLPRNGPRRRTSPTYGGCSPPTPT